MAEPEDLAAAPEASPPATVEFNRQIARFRSSVDAIRARADLSAKALGALGTTALSAVGIAKFADVFPLPAEWTHDKSILFAVLATVGGFLLLGVAIAGVTARFWRVSSPLFVSSELEDMPELKGEALRRARSRYRSIAERRGAPSLRAYEARAERLDRIADDAADPRRAALREEASVIRAEVGAAAAHVGADVVRDRATDAVRGPVARLLLAAFLIGLTAFGLGADYLAGERTDRAAIAKECAAAAKALSEQQLARTELPTICTTSTSGVRTPEQEVALATSCAAAVKSLDEQRLDADQLAKSCTKKKRGDPDGPPPPTAQRIVSAVVADLGKQLGACLAAATTGQDRTRCSRIDRALKGAAR